MKTITVRLPEPIAAEIEAESRRRSVSKSDVVRERLEVRAPAAEAAFAGIADLVGSVSGLPTDMSGRKKHFLRARKYGRKRDR